MRNQLQLCFDFGDVVKAARTLYAYEGTDPSKYLDWLSKLHTRHLATIKKVKERLEEKWCKFL